MPSRIKAPGAVPDSQNFWYTVTTTAMAASATEQQNVVVSEDADFLITGILAEASYWNGVTVIMKAAGNIEFMNSAVPLRCFAGALEKDISVAGSVSVVGANILDVPQRIPRMTAITFTVYNGSGQVNTVQIVLKGVKLFKSNQPIFARLKGGQVMRV